MSGDDNTQNIVDEIDRKFGNIKESYQLSVKRIDDSQAIIRGLSGISNVETTSSVPENEINRLTDKINVINSYMFRLSNQNKYIDELNKKMINFETGNDVSNKSLYNKNNTLYGTLSVVLFILVTLIIYIGNVGIKK